MPTHRRTLVVAFGLAAVIAAGALPAAADEPPPIAARVEPASDDAFADEAARVVSDWSLREKAATVVMGHIETTDADALHDYMADTGIGGFILMSANIPDTERELRELTAALTVDPALPPLIAIDQEGGDVSRLPWDEFPSAITLKAEDAAATRAAFAARGALLQRAGIGVNFGIVADVTGDPDVFIYRRALGTDPQNGSDRVAAAVAGEQGQSLATIKHFPGHGAAPGDSHSSIPTATLTKDAWASADGAPFRAGIDAGAPLLMFGHLAYPSVDAAPASLSAEWHRIAREELGFSGVIVTDDLGMLEASGIPEYEDPVANAVAALAAGNDIVLAIMFTDADSAPTITDGIVAAVESGALDAARLDDAVRRVTQLRLELAAAGRGMVPCAACDPVE